MKHIHRIYDTDLHFIIDPITRSITSESGKVTLMRNDHLSERFTFEVPRYIEGHDMSLTDKVEVHYNNISGSNKRTMNQDIYEVDDLQVSPDSDDIVICSWLLSKNATMFAGSLHFIVRFVCYDDDEISYQWFTDVFDKIKVLDGIYNNEVLDEKYDIDVVENWKRDVIAAFYESEVYATTLTARDESVASAAAAKVSETNALASENAAKISETNAAVSETNAKVSEDNAAASAANIKISETNMYVYADNAKASADAAKVSETNAAASAAAAKVSEDNAKVSETNAKTSETNAAISEKQAKDLVDALAGTVSGNPRGEYDPDATYTLLDVVSHGNRLWICTRPDTVGIEPSEENISNWMLAIELIPITNEEIDALDPIASTEEVSSVMSINEIDEIING